MSSAKLLAKPFEREILVGFLMLLAFTPTIWWMYGRWFADNSYYSHGILVPMVSLMLIYMKKEELRSIPLETSPWGLRVFALGIILYWTSALLHVYFTSGFAMLIVITGLILHFYGEKMLREISFPILFLIFMIPLPLIVVAFICFKLKIFATQMATFILNTIGFTSVQDGSLIKMPHCYVLVEDSCGGLRSLVSLTALASIFAHLLKSSRFKKVLLFLSAIPIATITNAFRIVFLAVVGEVFGTPYTQGPLHIISGYLVFAFAFLMLYGFKRLLAYGLS